MDTLTFNLELAFQEKGCPICHLKRKCEARYISSFLWEFVNDPGIRVHLVNALGFCREHAWQLQETEGSRYGSGLGTGIVYDDLTTRALKGLRELRADNSQFAVRRWMDRARGFLQRWFKRDGLHKQEIVFPQGLVPTEECRVCHIGRSTENDHLGWLVKNCTSTEFREWYRASDGLCLPHLRAALELTEDRGIRMFLIEVAEGKLGTLAHQLSEYLRKHTWDYRDEPKVPAEQSSWIRAVEFFVGKNECNVLRDEIPRLQLSPGDADARIQRHGIARLARARRGDD